MEQIKLKRIWAVCLFIIGIATFIIGVNNILGNPLPDSIIRLSGIFDLIVLPIFVYTVVKLIRLRENNE